MEADFQDVSPLGGKSLMGESWTGKAPRLPTDPRVSFASAVPSYVCLSHLPPTSVMVWMGVGGDPHCLKCGELSHENIPFYWSFLPVH